MEIVIRATVIFFFLWLITRGLGRKELSQLSAFDLILFVIMGDMVQQGVTQEDMSLTGSMLAVATMAMWLLVFSVLNYKFPKLRGTLEGVPLVIVRDGQILKKVIARERLTEDEVREEAREQGIGDLRSVKIALFESDGRFSFIKDESGSEESGGGPGAAADARQ